jgi:hypothetical protein
MRSADRRRGYRDEHPDIAAVPVGTEAAAGRQFVVAEPLSAKISDTHAAAEMEKGGVRADWKSAGVEVAQLLQQVRWQMSCNVLLNDSANGLWHIRPRLFRERVGVPLGAVAGVVGIEGGVVSEVTNLESSGVRAPDRRPRHDQHYHEARFLAA